VSHFLDQKAHGIDAQSREEFVGVLSAVLVNTEDIWQEQPEIFIVNADQLGYRFKELGAAAFQPSLAFLATLATPDLEGI